MLRFLRDARGRRVLVKIELEAGRRSPVSCFVACVTPTNGIDDRTAINAKMGRPAPGSAASSHDEALTAI